MTIIVSTSSVLPDYTAWTGFYDHILPELNGITPAQVDHMLRQVCIDFFEQTGIYSVELDTIDVVAGTATYDLDSPVSQMEPYQVKAAWYDDQPLDIAPLDVLVQANPYWGENTSTKPWAYTQRQTDQIVLYPNPSESLDDGLRVEATLRPTDDATGIVSWVASRYVRVLAAGVKGRLMAQPDRPWTRPEFAGVNLSEYASGRSKARIDANRSLTRASLQVRQRPLA
jgi:hypothetical protein